MGVFFEVLSIIHTFNFDDTCFLAQFNHVLSGRHGGLSAYAFWLRERTANR